MCDFIVEIERQLSFDILTLIFLKFFNEIKPTVFLNRHVRNGRKEVEDLFREIIANSI